MVHGRVICSKTSLLGSYTLLMFYNIRQSSINDGSEKFSNTTEKCDASIIIRTASRTFLFVNWANYSDTPVHRNKSTHEYNFETSRKERKHTSWTVFEWFLTSNERYKKIKFIYLFEDLIQDSIDSWRLVVLQPLHHPLYPLSGGSRISG